jgi:thioredoxin-like negative regulator of GroEL
VKEWTQQELREHAETVVKPFAVFLYTPFCGTCKLTERMLSIILTMEPRLPISKSNVNFLPQIIQNWQITSVPCIVIIEAGKDMKRIYNMKSVDHLFDELRPLREIKAND